MYITEFIQNIYHYLFDTHIDDKSDSYIYFKTDTNNNFLNWPTMQIMNTKCKIINKDFYSEVYDYILRNTEFIALSIRTKMLELFKILENKKYYDNHNYPKKIKIVNNNKHFIFEINLDNNSTEEHLFTLNF